MPAPRGPVSPKAPAPAAAARHGAAPGPLEEWFGAAARMHEGQAASWRSATALLRAHTEALGFVQGELERLRTEFREAGERAEREREWSRARWQNVHND